jgi:hypothetical protein
VYYSAATKQYVWHDLFGSAWVSSEEVGGTRYGWRVPLLAVDLSPANVVPDKIEGGGVSKIRHVTPLNLSVAPRAVMVSSKFSNIDGVYECQPNAHQYFPVYYSGRTKQYLWHELTASRWVSSEEVGGGKYVWRVPSNSNLSPAGIDPAKAEGGEVLVLGITNVEWTWQGKLDQKYNSGQLFTDEKLLPPRCTSIGNETMCSSEADVEWVRAMDLNRDDKDYLWGDISPTDIQQGNVGNCWLIAAYAAIAQYPHLIKSSFVHGKMSQTGQYTLKLFDVMKGTRGKWVTLEIDDMIPCKPREAMQRNAQPVFARASNNGELWPMILEKGFAAFIGSYAALQSGQASFAWQALTGCEVLNFDRDRSSGWTLSVNDVEKQRNKMRDHPEERRQLGLVGVDAPNLTSSELFSSLNSLKFGGQVLAASITSNDTAHSETEIAAAGLASDHAFTLLEVTAIDEHQLVRLR